MSERSAYRETLGFVAFGLGLFLTLSLISYDIADIRAPEVAPGAYHSFGGPLGALLAHRALSSIGIISAAWAGALLIWGLLVAFGYMLWPRNKLLVTFFLLTFVLAGLAQVALPGSLAVHLPRSWGGSVGGTVGAILIHHVGQVGAVIALCAAVLAVLILTGNFTLRAPDAPEAPPKAKL